MMRRNRFRTRPQVEGLESMTLLSGASAAMVAAAVAKTVPKTTLVLSGTAVGTYTAKYLGPTLGATIQMTASGKVSPLGQATIAGSSHVPGTFQSGKVQGSLVLRGAKGTVSLLITATVSTPSTSSSKMTYRFVYTITGGTGSYRNVKGTGSLVATILPSSLPVGSSPQVSKGRVVLVFGSGR